MTTVAIAAKLSPRELRKIDRIVKKRGLTNRSDFVKEAVRLYLSLASLEAETRLRMLRLINESLGTSGKGAGVLIREVREEDEG
jgi:metal-responsive CopG/Arc/MetJ family transcriptional regulator